MFFFLRKPPREPGLRKSDLFVILALWITKREVPGQMRRWVDEMLRGAAGRGRMHMPGHKGVAPFPQPDLYALDTTELDGTDDHAFLQGVRQFRGFGIV